MKTTHYYFPTVKEVPTDAQIPSHQLMLRAGMIRKVAAGIYTWLPLGLRILQKVEQIVREEMNRIGALEILMPSVQPGELWEESKRWNSFGEALLKFKDRHGRDFCLGPTHEEVITDLVRHELKSYKQLPVTFYQIQAKFRDETRPRFGVMRAREFLMKDAYSFHLDSTSLEKTYQDMYGAYTQIFTRLGLTFRAVLADTGSIGGDNSHEFQVLAQTGEDVIAYSDSSDYAANIEKASALTPTEKQPASGEAMQLINTPGLYTIDALVQALNLPITKTIKTLIVHGSDTEFVALIVRGDHELNEIKAEKLPAVASPLTFATNEQIKQCMGAGPGSLGPVNCNIPIIIDRDVALMSDFSCGANIDDKHYVNVNWERDTPLPEIADLRSVVVGDLSPDGKGKLALTRGIEVGHIFQLGNKYAKAMNANVLGENGKASVLEMGCYGIGVSRIVAAAIEQNHDDHGIIWPQTMAPFHVVIIPVNQHKSYRVKEAAEKLYQDFLDAGIEVLLEDRKERPGVLFADMDLIGIPYQVIIGERGLDQNQVEIKQRKTGHVEHVGVDDVLAFFNLSAKTAPHIENITG